MILSNFPQAILHVDADAFFASVEQVLHPELKGRPVITGAERGMVIALSYEAKAFGIKRGMRVAEAKRLCPRAVFVPSDYESYGLFSKRMFEILRRHTPQVEEYSIDEAFADLTGLKRLHRCSYVEMAAKIKSEIESELGFTVSVGLSLSKSLAKLASKFNKPSGLVAVSGRDIESFLANNRIGQVWGFGKNSTELLKKQGIETVLDFIRRPQAFAKKHLGKIGDEIWRELNGVSVYAVDSAQKSSYQSISKFKTFSPCSSDESFIFAQLLRNLERALTKMRRYHLATCRVVMILRSQDFRDDVLEITLSRHCTAALDLVHVLKENFDSVYVAGRSYRATGVVLCDLKEDSQIQMTIFEDPARMIKTSRLDCVVDQLNQQYGQQTVHLADSLAAGLQRDGVRNTPPTRQQNLLPGESKRRRISIPVLQIRMVG